MAEHKVCKACGEEKSLEDFSKHASFKDGRNSRCKSCKNAEARAFYKENKEQIWTRKRQYDHRDHDLKRKYGISRKRYDELAALQRHLCAICQCPPGAKGLVVDHCHATGQIRGLLCGACNLALGQFQDDHEVLARALDYLKAPDRFLGVVPQKHRGATSERRGQRSA